MKKLRLRNFLIVAATLTVLTSTFAQENQTDRKLGVAFIKLKGGGILINAFGNNSPAEGEIPLGSIITHINGEEVTEAHTNSDVAALITQGKTSVKVRGYFNWVMKNRKGTFECEIPLVPSSQLSYDNYLTNYVSLQNTIEPIAKIGEIGQYRAPEELTYIGLDLYRSIQTKRAPEGKARAKQLRTAIFYWQDAAEAGNITAKRLISTLIASHGTKIGFQMGDEKRIAEHLKDLADAGDSQSQIDRARFQVFGGLFGIKKNISDGAGTLKKHARLGNSYASALYGFVLMKHGKGKDDVDEGLRLVNKAQAAGSAYADFLLGFAYADGNCGVSKNTEFAKQLLNSALKEGVWGAGEVLAQMSKPRPQRRGPTQCGRCYGSGLTGYGNGYVPCPNCGGDGYN